MNDQVPTYLGQSLQRIEVLKLFLIYKFSTNLATILYTFKYKSAEPSLVSW